MSVLGTWRQTAINTTGAITYTQRIKVLDSVRRVYLRSVGVSDSTTAAAVCKVSIESGGTVYPILSVVCATAGLFYGFMPDIQVLPGEAIRFDWTAVVAADVLTAAVNAHADYG
jgi:hypothetical protein